VQREWLEERAVELLVESTRIATGRPTPCAGRAARVLTERAKQLLTASDELVGLVTLADRLDVSPAYLTDAFRRSEGTPLVRYQLQLRVMRAMQRLPTTDDLCALALDLGFSSHSHFSTAFRARTGITPSRYRELVRQV
jgi:AraC-like DNA-binding protein